MLYPDVCPWRLAHLNGTTLMGVGYASDACPGALLTWNGTTPVWVVMLGWLPGTLLTEMHHPCMGVVMPRCMSGAPCYWNGTTPVWGCYALDVCPGTLLTWKWHHPCMGVVMPRCMSVRLAHLECTTLYGGVMLASFMALTHCIPRLLQLGLPMFIL